MMLNDRKRFLCSAALAAVLVLLASGANAWANTVRCVPEASLNPSCTAATTYSTISLAVAAAGPGDLIVVGSGKYNESVTIPTSTQSLSLFGAQAGKDARVDRNDPLAESTVDATGTGNSAIIVDAPKVVIDGFTVQGGTAGTPAAGIYLEQSSAQVLNNILQNNSTGISLNDAGTGAVIEHNLFRNNNAGTASNSGYGIFSSGAPFVVITENEFSGNKTAAIYANQSGAIGPTITSNTSENDGSFVIVEGTGAGQFSHNHGRNFGHKGVLPGSQYGDGAVAIGPNNRYLEISDNDLEKGEAPINNGIAFTTVFGTGLNLGVNVRNNKITGFPGNGIVAEELSGTGTFGYANWIAGNEVYDNGANGIFIEGSSLLNSGMFLFDNEAEGNHVSDCQDTSTGSGTLETGNIWFNNIGSLSSPTGLCRPPGGIMTPLGRD
jgi:parallel beta-helix repeat protein